MPRTALTGFWRAAAIAVAAWGCSESSGTASSDPHAPSSLVAAPLGGGVHLTWTDNSDNEEVFIIERKEQGTAFASLDAVPFNSVLYHDANVILGIEYTYRVRAKLPTSFSAYSNEATVDPGAPIASGGSGGSSGGGSAGKTGSSGASGMNNSGGSPGGTAGAPSAGAGGVGTGGMVDPGGEVSFKNDVAPSLVKSCGSTTMGCHNSDQAVGRILPQYGPCKVIWYSAADAPLGATYTSGPNQGQPTGCPDLDLYERLMGLHSMLCAGSSWDQRARYVVPFDLDKSLIYQVIAGDPSMAGACTTMDGPVRKMPLVDPMILPNGVELGDEDIAKIRDWILQGAKNN